MEAFQALMRLILCGSAHPFACTSTAAEIRAYITLAALVALPVLWVYWRRTGQPALFGYVLWVLWLPVRLFWGVLYLAAAAHGSPFGWVVIVFLLLRYLGLHMQDNDFDVVNFGLILLAWRLRPWCWRYVERLQELRDWYPRPLPTAAPRRKPEVVPVVVPALSAYRGRVPDERAMIGRLAPHLQRLILQERREPPQP